MEPYFSIIIPLFNKEKHIKATINSVLSQSYTNFEIIIINDGSTDNSETIVSKIQDSRIQIYTTKNKGVSHARNFGISKSKSPYIVLLDADDIWKPNHLEHLKQMNEAFPNCGMYATAYVKRKYGKIFKAIFKALPKDENWTGIINHYFESTLANSIASGSSVMIPKNVFNNIGDFNIQYNSGEDTDMWIRIALNYPVAFTNKVSVIHNMDATNKITNHKLSNRQHINIDAYEKYCKNTPFLKQYLDLNRASIALQYKLESKNELAKNVLKHIDYTNLTTVQQLILKMPSVMIKFLYGFRNLLQQLQFDLRLFR